MRGYARRNILLLLPPVVTATMVALFASSGQWFGQTLGYFLAFLFYWGIWCLTVPAWLLGRERLRTLLAAPGSIRWLDLFLLLLPLFLSYGYAFPRALP